VVKGVGRCGWVDGLGGWPVLGLAGVAGGVPLTIGEEWRAWWWSLSAVVGVAGGGLLAGGEGWGLRLMVLCVSGLRV